MENEAILDDCNLGDALKESLEQAIAFKNGDRSKARSIVLEIPTPNDGDKNV